MLPIGRNLATTVAERQPRAVGYEIRALRSFRTDGTGATNRRDPPAKDRFPLVVRRVAVAVTVTRARQGRLFPQSCAQLSPSSRNKGVPHRMSSIVYDYLLPLLGPEQAAYWAQILVISPAG
ncbi:hypothetical protein NWFMUON74_49950 [Nocardia wallacei]|uniref:Uncharacterized protein n=2 Tax=Nocardia TaxID=1817 RepID=A0A7G1KSN0_9NOCA|nr:hypothetical protein NWFMUON74_49950 [Nocardia wallacei]